VFEVHRVDRTDCWWRIPIGASGQWPKHCGFAFFR